MGLRCARRLPTAHHVPCHDDTTTPARSAIARTVTSMPLNLFGAMRPLNRTTMLRDSVAGITLASMNIPQVLGYTRIAGTPVVTGLYTLLLPLVAFSIFGSSRHLVVAADSATAAIFASGLSAMAPPSTVHYMAL